MGQNGQGTPFRGNMLQNSGAAAPEDTWVAREKTMPPAYLKSLKYLLWRDYGIRDGDIPGGREVVEVPVFIGFLGRVLISAQIVAFYRPFTSKKSHSV
jgi:hypothetical protein